MLRLAKGVGLDVLLWVAGIALVGTNVFLVQENRSLKAASYGGASPKIVEGKHLPRNMFASTLDSALRPIDFPPAGAARTLLITLSPVCPHCKANHKNWSAIAQELRREGGWRILWVSRDSVEMTKDYAEDAGIPPAETYADPTFRTYTVLDLRAVPNTVVIDARGVVEKVWTGELDAAGWKDVFSYLHMSPTLMPSL